MKRRAASLPRIDPRMYKPRSSQLDSPVAVVGAGPHGLSAAAHLRHGGLEPIVFGDPMAFWRDQMPAGMLLRSSPRASSIADPERKLRLGDWAAAHGKEVTRPVTVEDFLAYGQWYQRQAVPDVDPRLVRRVSRANGGFELSLEDGDVLHVARVAVAAGLAPFPPVPQVLRGQPPHPCSPPSHPADL